MDTNLEKPSRFVDENLLTTVANKPCLICGCWPSDPAHIQSRGAGGDDVEWNVLPLCRYHHSSQHAQGWKTFATKNPLVLEELTRKGWSFDSRNRLGRNEESPSQ